MKGVSVRKSSSPRGVHVTLDLADGVSLRATRTSREQREARSIRLEKQSRDKQKRIQHLEDLVTLLTSNAASSSSAKNEVVELTQARVTAGSIESIWGRLRVISDQLRMLQARRNAFVKELEQRARSLKKKIFLENEARLSQARSGALRSKDRARLAQINRLLVELTMKWARVKGQILDEVLNFKTQADAEKSTLLAQLATARNDLRVANDAARREKVLERSAAARRNT
jgi:hypothetical protein